MLSKKNRVDRKAIEKIFKEGKITNSSHLILKFIVNPQNTIPKVSFIAPKTVSKKATIRNLLRRRGYAVLKKYINSLPLGFVGAFVFSKKATQVFGGRKNKNYNPIQNIESEIKIIIKKL